MFVRKMLFKQKYHDQIYEPSLGMVFLYLAIKLHQFETPNGLTIYNFQVIMA